MGDTFEVFKQINWFLTPVSDAIIFLFTTSTGIFVLVAIFLFYLFLSINNALQERRLLHANAGGSSIPSNEFLFIVFNETFKLIGKIFTNIPVLLGTVFLLLFIVGFSSGFSTLDEYLSNQKKIKELQTVLKHLDARYKVAEVNVNEVSNQTSSLTIKFLDPSKLGMEEKSQSFTIKGTDIYFDAAILNFEYSEVSASGKKNIAIPYRIFSENVPMDDGILFDLKDSAGVPVFLHRKDETIYGISPKTYNETLKEVTTYFYDKNKARAAGIRSIYGNAVHRQVKKGDVFFIWIEQTGGLVIKDEVQF